MPLDAAAGPGATFKRLIGKLADRHDHYDLLDRYYRNEVGVPHDAGRVAREAHARLMRICRTNFAELIVAAVRERIRPGGFRAGAVGQRRDDDAAWAIWQANSLDADFNLVLTPQLVMGCAYAIVGDVDPEVGAPLITPEDPRQVAVETAPGRRRKVTAALKVFRDEPAAVDRAYLYLPGIVVRAARPVKRDQPMQLDMTGWEWDGDPQELPVLLRNSVPVVPFLNRPDLFGRPTGEFEAATPILDRINTMVLQRLQIGRAQAFRARAVKGLPQFDENGREIDYSNSFGIEPGSLWQVPEGAELWESAQTDLGPLRLAIRDDVQDLAAVTRTPLHYLTPDSANGSAEGASLAREGLEFKAEDQLAQVGESVEQVMALAFAFAGDETRAKRRDMEVVWRPPQRHSLAERADAATKAQAAGMSKRWAMENVWQMTPQEIAREEAEQAREALMVSLLAPPADEPAPEEEPVAPGA